MTPEAARTEIENRFQRPAQQRRAPQRWWSYDNGTPLVFAITWVVLVAGWFAIKSQEARTARRSGEHVGVGRPDVQIEIIRLRGCEYVATSTTAGIQLVHAADCMNPAHGQRSN